MNDLSLILPMAVSSYNLQCKAIVFKERDKEEEKLDSLDSITKKKRKLKRDSRKQIDLL